MQCNWVCSWSDITALKWSHQPPQPTVHQPHNTQETRHNTQETRHNTQETRHNTQETRHNTQETRHNTQETRPTSPPKTVLRKMSENRQQLGENWSPKPLNWNKCCIALQKIIYISTAGTTLKWDCRLDKHHNIKSSTADNNYGHRILMTLRHHRGPRGCLEAKTFPLVALQAGQAP